MATKFANIYYVRNNAGTYEAWRDDETAATYSGTDLVVDVLNPIEAANSSGNFMVVFGIGTFDMGTSNWTMVDMESVTLVGAGMGATIIQNSSTAAADTEPFSFTRCNRVTVQDLTISAGGSSRQSSDGLDFDDGNDIIVRRVHILVARGDGIVFDGKDNLAESVNNIVDSCIIGGAGSTINFTGIQLLVTDRCQVINSQIGQCGESGIKINRQVSASRYSERNIIANNIIEENNEAGIEILESRDNIITGNVIRNNGQVGPIDDGILIDYFGNTGLEPIRNIIRGNIFADDQDPSETQDTGVRIQDAETADTIIEANTFRDHVTAPIFDTGTNTIIRGNIGAADKVVRQVSAATTLTFDEAVGVIDVDTSTASVTVTLPDNAAAAGRSFIIRNNSGTNNVVVSRAGTDTIGGVTTKTVSADESAIGVASVGGGDWLVVSTRGTVT